MIIETTERLIIREADLYDASFLHELVNSDGWIKYIGDRNVKNVQDAVNYITKNYLKSYDENGFGFWIVENMEKLPIGICGMVKRPNLDHVDVGYAFLEEFSGKGYAYEASSAVVKLARERFGLKKLVAIVQRDNERSIKLLVKLGFSFEKMIEFDAGVNLCQYAILF